MVNERSEFDLGVLAPNGLRRGRTTGSCATAAVKAALYLLLRDRRCDRVEVMLPDGAHYLVVPSQELRVMERWHPQRIKFGRRIVVAAGHDGIAVKAPLGPGAEIHRAAAERDKPSGDDLRQCGQVAIKLIKLHAHERRRIRGSHGPVAGGPSSG